jgi:hypothetical protein
MTLRIEIVEVLRVSKGRRYPDNGSVELPEVGAHKSNVASA